MIELRILPEVSRMPPKLPFGMMEKSRIWETVFLTAFAPFTIPSERIPSPIESSTGNTGR
jgi:hypothetical protein